MIHPAPSPTGATRPRPQLIRPPTTTADLVFTGFNKRVAALHRETGNLVWKWSAPSGSSYTSLLLDGDRLIVSVHGYMYALDAATGHQIWANPMSGFGYGVASLASVRGGATSSTVTAATAAEDARTAS